MEAPSTGSLTCPSCRGSGARVEIGERARVVDCDDCEGTGTAPGLIDEYTSEELSREALVACAQADAARIVAQDLRLHRGLKSGPLLLEALQRAERAFRRASDLASASLGLDLTPPEMPVERSGGVWLSWEQLDRLSLSDADIEIARERIADAVSARRGAR